MLLNNNRSIDFTRKKIVLNNNRPIIYDFDFAGGKIHLESFDIFI